MTQRRERDAPDARKLETVATRAARARRSEAPYRKPLETGRCAAGPDPSAAGARVEPKDEILTSAAAVVLVVLLVAEGITIVHMRRLLSAHMFIGLVLIPPVIVKLGSTGYRMVSYYAGARAYRVNGAPLLPLRLMAPVLIASTLGVLATGVAMLVAGLANDRARTSRLLTRGER